MATGKQNGTKKKKFDMEATVNSKQQFTGPKATEGSVGNYVNNVRASKDYYDKQEKKNKQVILWIQVLKEIYFMVNLSLKKNLRKLLTVKSIKILITNLKLKC